MSSTPEQLYKKGDEVTTPIGVLPVLDVTPVLWGDQVMDWLYHFGEGYEEKFTGEELTKR